MAFNSLLNRTLQTLRGGVGQATRAGRGAANQGIALGKRFANRNPEPKSGMDDVTLTRKVETEIFRPVGSPKGKVDVNAVDGVVWLRGEVKNNAQMESLEAKVRAIPEVQDVKNLLHLPKTPAPSRTRKGGTKTTTRKAQAKRFDRTETDEKPKASEAEPLPAQAATTGTGRKAAPLGGEEPTTATPGTATGTSVTGGIAPRTGTSTDEPDTADEPDTGDRDG